MIRLVTDPDEHEAPERPDNVILLNLVTRLDINADTILNEAIGQLDGVIIIGYRKSTSEHRTADDEYFASSFAAGDTVLWLLERAKHKLMRTADRLENGGADDPA